MKILMLNPVGFLGGAERCLLTAIKGLIAIGHEVTLIPCTPGPLADEAAKLGARVHPLPMPNIMASTGDSGGRIGGILRSLAALPATWVYARKLRRLIREMNPDIIHSNGLKTHLLLAMAKPAALIVWHLHDFLAPRPLASRLLRRASRNAARAIAISNAVAHDAAAILPGLPIDTVLNAIDTERFTPVGERADLDSLAGLPPAPEGTLRIGLVATYARWKGHDIFLQAAHQAIVLPQFLANAHLPPMRFYVVGSPLYHTGGSQWSLDELQALTKELDIDSMVGFVPFQSDPAPIYRALDIVVHASTKPEPFGLTIVEAMACSGPVIVSNAGGAAELFTENRDALGFPPANVDQLAECILKLAWSAQTRMRLSSAARQSALARFSAIRYAPQLLEVYARARASVR